MDSIKRDIFRAIHEGKWLSIEYHNKDDEVTKFWIGIKDLNVKKRFLKAEGLHLGKYTIDILNYINIDSIISSKVIDGSYYPVNKALTEDIYLNPDKYKELFDNTANLKILTYLEMCNRMDTVPYYSEYELVKKLDRDKLQNGAYPLSNGQFEEIVSYFQYRQKGKKTSDGRIVMQQLAMNVLSLYTRRGLYVLAYRKLLFDVKNRVLRPDEDITVCTEFCMDKSQESIRRFLDADDYELLNNFEKNAEKIKDCLGRRNDLKVDDMPYIIGLGMNIALDLHKEYQAIINMYSSDKEKVTVPIQAFFGDLLKREIRTKAYPVMLLNQKVNLDQLLAINNAMKYSLTYVQGPPGTGKTNTIINTILTAFFNGKTVLFCSYNNHPIENVFEKLTSIKYVKGTVPFPVLRLGNYEVMREAAEYIKKLYAAARNITVYKSTLDKNKDSRTEKARQLSGLLKRYESVLDMSARKETINRMLEYGRSNNASAAMMPFELDLQNNQLNSVQRNIDEAGEITDEEAFKLLDNHTEGFYKYLYYTSAEYIQKLGKPRFEPLIKIINTEDENLQYKEFSSFLSVTANIKLLQEVFPVIITTCISAHKLGEPEPSFDMVIMDEASQCNTAVSLVPVIRGKKLMLVGDPQQLNPVILLNEITNRKLMKRYNVTDEYDYCKNSIYKTFLACDSVSDEILLRNHYRCHSSIIQFNNRKYYNSKLNIKSGSQEKNPLVFVNVKDSGTDYKNTAPDEVREIVRYAELNRDKDIGVITPFVNQKKLIEEALKEAGLDNITCGTIHAFQGDEKDTVLFSTAITSNTGKGTYNWLKNNKELINVATSRAKDKLIILCNEDSMMRLHTDGEDDDLFELAKYVKTNGMSQVTPKAAASRALGVKPYSTETEEAFLKNLNHALDNMWLSQSRFSIEKEVPISQVFQDNINYCDLFYTGRFDFVVYERHGTSQKLPVLAIELDGKEHFDDFVVKKRDEKKNEICKAHNLQLIRVENSYARRYNYIKEILINYFSKMH